MENENKNTELDNKDKKLNISDVILRFLSDFKKRINWTVFTFYAIMINVVMFYDNIIFLKTNGFIIGILLLAYLHSKIEHPKM